MCVTFCVKRFVPCEVINNFRACTKNSICGFIIESDRLVCNDVAQEDAHVMLKCIRKTQK